MPRINGVKGAYLQPPRYGRNQSGQYTIYCYEGTKNELLALVGSIEGLNGTWEMKESFSGAKCELTAQFAMNVTSGGAEVPVDQWEFSGGRVEKDLLETDTALITGLTQSEKTTIRNAIANQTMPSLSTQPAKDIYSLELHGVRARIQFSPTLKHTQTVSSNWTVKAALTNVGRIILPGSIVSLESIPNTVLFNLPNDVWTGSGNVGPTKLTTALAYGWLKMHPSVRVAAYQKNQMEQEWHYGLWSIYLYGNPL